MGIKVAGLQADEATHDHFLSLVDDELRRVWRTELHSSSLKSWRLFPWQNRTWKTNKSISVYELAEPLDTEKVQPARSCLHLRTLLKFSHLVHQIVLITLRTRACLNDRSSSAVISSRSHVLGSVVFTKKGLALSCCDYSRPVVSELAIAIERPQMVSPLRQFQALHLQVVCARTPTTRRLSQLTKTRHSLNYSKTPDSPVRGVVDITADSQILHRAEVGTHELGVWSKPRSR